MLCSMVMYGMSGCVSVVNLTREASRIPKAPVLDLAGGMMLCALTICVRMLCVQIVSASIFPDGYNGVAERCA